MRRSAAVGVFCMVLCMLLCASAAGLASAPEAAPLVMDGGSADGMIRVYLSTIGGKSVYNLTVSGAYSIGGVALPDGSKVKVELSGGTVYVTANGTRSAMGSSATISRQRGGVKIAESLAPSNVYPGDMRFFYSGGKAYIVCYLYIEEYTYGVLPYEMDNSFPLEALKAQAVAARTYAIRAKKSTGSYDVTDTTTHQVFRGVNYNHKRCIQAVDETWGIVIKYNGSYAGAYYSASNGGQTEANQNVWGGSQLGYLTIKDDPFDLANKSAVKKSYLIYSTPQNGSSVSAYAMIRNALAKKLGGSADGYTITEITDIMLHTPRFAAPSSLYTQMRVTVRYNGSGSATVDIPVFKTVESSLGLGINGDNNELYTVEREAKGFRVTARRYGHGVGMSQRGAEQMANDGLSYAQIIGFYYTGVQRVRMNFQTSWPSSTPTPPVVEEKVAGEATETPARVELSNPNDRLNLRAQANAESSVLARLSHGAELTVLSDDGTWCKVRYGSLIGYVARDFLLKQQAESSAPVAPGTAVVTLTSGSLNVRSEGKATAEVIGVIPGGAAVTVVEEGASWSRVTYNNQTGYVMSQFLTIASAPEKAGGADLAVVSLQRADETVNLRLNQATDSPVLARLPHATALAVVERLGGWTKVDYLGTVGYVMSDYIRLAQGETTSASPPPQGSDASQASAATHQPNGGARKAVVSVAGGTLNLRTQPNENAEVARGIPDGTVLVVTADAEGWCAVSYDGFSGYVVRSFLIFTDGEAAVAPAATPIAGATAAPDASSAWVRTNDGDRVNLRRRATTSSTVLERIVHGTQLQVLEWGAKWTKVAINGKTGFVNSAYLVTEEPENAGNTAAMAAGGTFGGEAYVYTRDGGAVHLRRSASKSSDSVAMATYGTPVTLLEESGEWRKVIYKGLTGYILSEYLVLTRPAAGSTHQPQATPAPNGTSTAQNVSTERDTGAQQAEGNAAGDNKSMRIGDAKTTLLNTGKTVLNSPTATLSIRAEPDDLAMVVGALRQGEKVEVYQYCGSDARWVYVKCGSAEGYALRAHFALDLRIAAVTLDDTGSSLSVRALADASSAVVAALPHGSLITVLSAKNGWASIRMGDGTPGFVSGNYLLDI